MSVLVTVGEKRRKIGEDQEGRRGRQEASGGILRPLLSLYPPQAVITISDRISLGGTQTLPTRVLLIRRVRLEHRPRKSVSPGVAWKQASGQILDIQNPSQGLRSSVLFPSW